MTKHLVDGQMQLTDAGTTEISKCRIKHPDGEPALDLPQFPVSPLGTGNNSQRDDQIFERRSVGQRLSVDLPTLPSWFAMTMNIPKRYSVDVS